MEKAATASDVVIVGAGLAGLAAGAAAARSGARVVILDAVSPGGRARTDAKDGFRFNRGPHALYRAGACRRVLARLGVRPATHVPPLLASLALADGDLHPALSLHTLGPRAAAVLGALVRLTSYASDPDRMSADLAIRQLRCASRGVGYPNDGWQALVTGLLAGATEAGAQLRAHAAATEIAGEPG